MYRIFAALLVIAVALFFLVPELQLSLALRSRSPVVESPTIVMLGDSHTFVPNWPRLTGCPTIAGMGVSGNTSQHLLERLDQVIAKRPKIVLIMIGTNDMFHADPAVTLTNIDKIAATLQAAGIRYELLTPPPLPEKDGIVRIIARATIKIPFTEDDLRADRIHLRRSGYAKWRDAIAPLIKQYC